MKVLFLLLASLPLYAQGGCLGCSSGGGSPTSPAGSDTQVQVNDGGSFGAADSFIFDQSAVAPDPLVRIGTPETDFVDFFENYSTGMTHLAFKGSGPALGVEGESSSAGGSAVEIVMHSTKTSGLGYPSGLEADCWLANPGAGITCKGVKAYVDVSNASGVADSGVAFYAYANGSSLSYGYTAGFEADEQTAVSHSYGFLSRQNVADSPDSYAFYSAGDAPSHFTGFVDVAATSTTPGDPASSSNAKIYVKGGKLVVQYNDAGTVRYKYLDLTGTGVTWTHSTSAP